MTEIFRNSGAIPFGGTNVSARLNRIHEITLVICMHQNALQHTYLL